jgi:hypothetical protein
MRPDNCQLADHSSVERPLEFAVYGGLDCIGRAIENELGKRAAFNAVDELIGIFPSRQAATAAIVAAAK